MEKQGPPILNASTNLSNNYQMTPNSRMIYSSMNNKRANLNSSLNSRLKCHGQPVLQNPRQKLIERLFEKPKDFTNNTKIMISTEESQIGAQSKFLQKKEDIKKLLLSILEHDNVNLNDLIQKHPSLEDFVKANKNPDFINPII